ncbi:MAG: sigma-54-dependent transcriptional regulator [Planctomycetota bacterium]
MHERLLVVDDEPVLREALAALLREEGYSVRAVAHAHAALDALEEEAIDLVLSDVKMLDPASGKLSSRAGFELLQQLVQKYPGTPVVMITSSSSVDTAVEAMRLGAVHYIVKPFRKEEIKKAVVEALSKSSSKRGGKVILQPIHSTAPSMRSVVDACIRAAASDVTILLVGPQGSGKDYTARAIHEASSRGTEPFVPIAIRAIPDNLIEAELFGNDRGAFTGALRLKRGVFEQAGRGTLFLDAIDEIPLSSQAKLLVPIEKKEIKRVGGNRPVPFLARIMAASSVNLLERVRGGTFRNDLYYLLRVVTIELPPLRERREDVPGLAREFLMELAHDDKKNLTISDGAVELLQNYDFPGNIRELRNLIRSAATLSRDGRVGVDDIRKALALPAAGASTLPTIQDTKRCAERDRILQALARHPKNLSDAASELAISRTTLWRKMRELGIAKSDDENKDDDAGGNGYIQSE